MRKSVSIITSIALSAVILLSVFGCGGGNKKTEQAPAKTAATQEVKKEAPKEEKTGFIVGTDVNAREKASTDSAIVGTFTLGEKVVILADETEWAKVKRADGKECYVFKKFLGDQAALDKRQAKYNLKSGPYPVFLNGDPNYILVDAQMGSAWYLVRNSVQRKQTSPNEWDIPCDVVSVGDADKGNTSIGGTQHFVFHFSEQHGIAGVMSDYGVRYFKYDGPRSVTMVKNGAGAMAYYIATGKKWSKFGLGDDFYSRANL